MGKAGPAGIDLGAEVAAKSGNWATRRATLGVLSPCLSFSVFFWRMLNNLACSV